MYYSYKRVGTRYRFTSYNSPPLARPRLGSVPSVSSPVALSVPAVLLSVLPEKVRSCFTRHFLSFLLRRTAPFDIRALASYYGEGSLSLIFMTYVCAIGQTVAASARARLIFNRLAFDTLGSRNYAIRPR